ncbi:hypothetical protein KUV28_05410 [Ferrimonas balearica]|nr:hypothetical protein [Ferrimonas balearica]
MTTRTSFGPAFILAVALTGLTPGTSWADPDEGRTILSGLRHTTSSSRLEDEYRRDTFDLHSGFGAIGSDRGTSGSRTAGSKRTDVWPADWAGQRD